MQEGSTWTETTPRVTKRSTLEVNRGVTPTPRNEFKPAVTPRRLALVFDLAPRKLGSIEDWIVELAVAARKRGHQIDLLCHAPIHDLIRSRLRTRGVGIVELPQPIKPSLEALRRLASYDAIQLNFFSLSSSISLLALAAKPGRVVLVDHTSSLPTDRVAPRGFPFNLAEKAVLNRLGAIVGVSHWVTRRNKTRYQRMKFPFVTIHNGVQTNRFTPRQERPANERLQLLSVANLIEAKGIHVILKALARISSPRPTLRIVGDGPEKARLEEMAKALGVGADVEFLGLRSDVDQLLQSSDVFVHPAIWGEAFGLTIAEAMATGLPVLASRIGGIPEIIEHDHSGLLFTPGSEEELASLIQRVSAEERTRNRLGTNARERVVKRFGMERTVEEHLGILEQVSGAVPRL